MSSRVPLPVSIAVVAALTAGGVLAQVQLTLPDVSQRATVSQLVGLSEVTVVYHRPVAKGRQVWGSLVPFGQVWRAGANENTTIAFSTPVTVADREIPAGTYGLHVIPGEREWVFVLSNVSWAWGSFTYDAAEDAVRATVPAQDAPHAEVLTYTLDAPTADSVAVTLHWGTRQASLPVKVKTHDVVLASLRRELRGPAQFGWQGWNQAARYCLTNKVGLDEGLAWADRSLGIAANMTNLMTKAGLLEAKGEAAQAVALRERAMTLATEAEMNAYGYQLLGAGKVDEAIAAFARNVKDHPASWNVHDSLAEAYATRGDTSRAIELYTKARGLAPANQHARIDGELAKLKK